MATFLRRRNVAPPGLPPDPCSLCGRVSAELFAQALANAGIG